MSTPHEHKIIARFHTWLYSFLLIGGVIASGLATKLIIDKTLTNTIERNLAFGTLNGFVKVVLYAFLFGNVFHSFLIYIDLLLMERNPEKYYSSFPEWFNTKLEIFLRLVALALLILAISGKVVPLLDAAVSSDPSREWKMWAFIIGNIALFLTLGIWDVMALVRRRKTSGQRDWRVWAYLVSDAIALICWLLICSSVIDNRIGPGLAVVLFVISIVYFFLMLIRVVSMAASKRRPSDTPAPPPPPMAPAILPKEIETV